MENSGPMSNAWATPDNFLRVKPQTAIEASPMRLTIEAIQGAIAATVSLADARAAGLGN
jgi:hypothetical protein